MNAKQWYQRCAFSPVSPARPRFSEFESQLTDHDHQALSFLLFLFPSQSPPTPVTPISPKERFHSHPPPLQPLPSLPLQIPKILSTHTLLLKSHQFGEAEHFMKTQMGKSSTILMWDSLIRGVCVKLKDPEKALSLLEDCLRNHGMLLPSSLTFCSLVHSFSCNGEMGRAVEVLELMTDEKAKCPFDDFVCSSVISGFCKIGKPEIAVSFFENATSSGALRPSVVTYTAHVNALCMLFSIVVGYVGILMMGRLRRHCKSE